jgi:cyanophycinase
VAGSQAPLGRRPHTRDRKQADDPEFVKPLAAATAVFITNGHRDRIFDAYRGTLVEKELHKLHARGGTIAGTGTGAAVLGEWVIDRTSEKRLTEPGLNLLQGMLVEDRDDTERFAAAIASHRPLLGLMVEPDTAALIRGDNLRVVGEKTISVQLATDAKEKARSQTLKAGEEIDLAKWRD